jgi:hypothetical protein
MHRILSLWWATAVVALATPVSVTLAQTDAASGQAGAGTAGGTADRALSPSMSGGMSLPGMMGADGTQIAATDRHVYVLRHGRLSAFDTRTMRLLATAMLPGMGMQQAVAGSRAETGGPDPSIGAAARPGATGAGGRAANTPGTLPDRPGGAAAGTPGAAGAGQGTEAAGRAGAAGPDLSLRAGVGVGGSLSGTSAVPGGFPAGSMDRGGQEPIRLVATNRAVYVLHGDRLLAFEAATLRSIGAATLPAPPVPTGETGLPGAGTSPGGGSGGAGGGGPSDPRPGPNR